MLNPKYFKTIITKKHNKCEFSIIQPLDNPMILFSKIDNTPLASLHLKCQNGKALITKKHYDNDIGFQGIVNKDNQEIELVISNLTADVVRFNIKKDNYTNLNEIDCLSPYQSCSIKSDRDTCCALVLNSVKNKKTSTRMTVGEAESADTYAGTYYSLFVRPQKISKIIDKFKDTYWACVDLFCIIEGELHWNIITDPNDHACDPEDLFDIDKYIPQINNTDWFEISRPGFHDTWRPLPKTIDELRVSNNPKISYKKFKLLSKTIDKQQNDALIKKSYVGKVSSGRKIEVNGIPCHLQFAYEYTSAPCKIGLSIDERLVFNEVEDMTETASTYMDNIIKEDKEYNVKLLNDIEKVYDSDKCVICLAEKDERKLDMVYYQCGHKCCHYDCGQTLKKCPICRKNISAYIQI